MSATGPAIDKTCHACWSYLASTERLEVPVCGDCAHMIDAHGARLADAYAADPCKGDASAAG